MSLETNVEWELCCFKEIMPFCIFDWVICFHMVNVFSIYLNRIQCAGFLLTFVFSLSTHLVLVKCISVCAIFPIHASKSVAFHQKHQRWNSKLNIYHWVVSISMVHVLFCISVWFLGKKKKNTITTTQLNIKGRFCLINDIKIDIEITIHSLCVWK